MIVSFRMLTLIAADDMPIHGSIHSIPAIRHVDDIVSSVKFSMTPQIMIYSDKIRPLVRLGMITSLVALQFAE